MQNLSSDFQQHLLTIQQLTQQVQALSSLKRSRSTSDQRANEPTDSTDSAAVSHATAIQVDTFPGLETNSKPQDADSTAESGAVRKDKLTIRTVDPLGDEVRFHLLGPEILVQCTDCVLKGKLTLISKLRERVTIYMVLSERVGMHSPAACLLL